jgi:hypothetical protein
MVSDWTVIQSFQHNQDILRAINTLSIFLKLKQKEKKVDTRRQAVREARHILSEFLDRLETATLQNNEKQPAMPLGVSPRLQQLAQGYWAARQHHRFHSRLFTESISAIKPLLASEEIEDQKLLIDCLAELRILVEEHLQADESQVLGTV